MPVVTLTTDFGLKDFYVAMIKGALLGENEQLTIVDITHQVDHFDIVQAAFLFRNVWPSFPKGSIHLLSVNDLREAHNRFLVLPWEGHFFIGPDNGLFSLIFPSLPEEAYLLPFPEEAPFPLQALFAQAVKHLLSGRPLQEIGRALGPGDQVQRITFQPVISRSRIRGSVIYIDHYENVVVNVSRTLFEEVGRQRPFSLVFKRHEPLTRLSRNYFDVPVGETLCWFNPAGFLEIAIHMGKAGALLGLRLEDTVQIDFHEPE